jgi:hypothetical protein
MRKTPVLVVLVAMALLIGGAAPLMVGAQGAATMRGMPPGTPPNDLPQRTTRQFAPFIRALLQRRLTQAQQLFKLRRPVLATMEEVDVMRVLSRYQRPQRYDLNLVAGRLYGPNTGILLFTIVNEEGPVYFKVHYYTYQDQTYVDRLEISDDWDYMEAAIEHLDLLPTPVSVPLNSGDTVP